MRQSADVVIIGGGVMGCSMLYNLARLGVTNSLLVERDVLGSGSTGRSQAICRMHYSNPVTASMAWESLKVFTNFDDAVGGSSGFVKTGYLVIVEDVDRPGLERNVAMQQELGINTSQVTAADLRELAPMLAVDETEALAWEPESGYADPYMLTTSYAARARDMGAEIMLRAPAQMIEVSGDRVRAVVTDQGRVETPIAVVAAGPWSKIELAKVGVDVPLVPVRHQVALLTRPLDRIPDHPIVGDIAQSLSFRPDGSSMTMLGVGEDEVADVDSYNQGVEMSGIADALGRMARRMPGMADSYVRGGWAGLFTTTPDWHPILDRVPGIEGLYCAVGFSGHGFKLSPMIGLAMAELIAQGRATSIDISPLRFTRFAEGDLLSSSFRYRVLA
ncbi:MAG: FAD-binding oxidoreductase [Dehalococcoidia bacterium]|jgi:sarcosine oxidase subunit beta|nr:FAD-binding oxidoreductase [Dehalococcoidia bacterium]MDP7201110.1 FAD-binding oxidoreductase [Dehalococcoidia bacterium]MDP7510695.1 FAD-binding oxidoreductase [Dehalococcoidia bacterium]HJN87829.1 FAD-binding oxidoreductase [Dehalococcoidia bacterium]